MHDRINIDHNFEIFVDNFRNDIEGLFVNFAYNLIAAVSCVDRTTLPKFIDNLLVKISKITSDPNLKVDYVYNLMKSTQSDSAASEIIFKVDWIYWKWKGFWR